MEFQEIQKNKAIEQLNNVEPKMRKIGRGNDENSVTHDQVTRYIDQDLEDEHGKRFSAHLVDDKNVELQSRKVAQNVPVLMSTVVMESDKCIND